MGVLLDNYCKHLVHLLRLAFTSDLSSSTEGGEARCEHQAPGCLSRECALLTRASVPADPVQPIPLEYMRLLPSDKPPETRRERSEGIIASLSSPKQELFPFTFYHAGSRTSRTYTLYAASPGIRKMWKDALQETIGVRKVQQESNRVRIAPL